VPRKVADGDGDVVFEHESSLVDHERHEPFPHKKHEGFVRGPSFSFVFFVIHHRNFYAKLASL
jgi:hypothetical protein